MAEGQVSLSSFKEKFTDQLTCSVCLDQYTNPKILPCYHSFCLKCIEKLPKEIKDRKYYISCPTCRADHQLPQGGANNLPNNFNINSMLDLQNQHVSSQSFTQSICLKHNNDIKIYCETCCQVICRDCTISTEHNKHTYYLISECYPKHHQQMMDNLHTVKHKLNDMDTAMTHLATRERKMRQQGENIKEEINQHTQKLIDSIQRSQTHLTQQVDTIVQKKTQTLATQRQQAQKLHTQLQTCQNTIEHNLKEWTQLQILAQKHTMMDKMNIATQHVDLLVFQPIEHADIEFNIDENSLAIGTITSKAYSTATLEALPCLAKQPSTATLTLQSQDGSPFLLPPSLISSTLSSPGNKHSVKCPITQTQPGKHSIAFTPSTRRDQLIVQVGGVDVPDSPFTLPVIPTPEMRGEPVNIITGLNPPPRGIAVCNNGDIVVGGLVAEQGAHRITVLNEEGEKIKLFGSEGTEVKFKYLHGVAISNDGHFLVTDEHRLQKLTTDGVCVKSVGSGTKGSGQLQFDCPTGIAVHPTTGQIFVADCRNNRIQVFTDDLTYLDSISSYSSYGLLYTRFNNPCDVALDSKGYLYVIESNTHCIIKISDKGKHIQSFGSHGSDPGQLSRPISLAIHHNLVYVCESSNHRVSVFNTDGKFVKCFGEHKIQPCPMGMTIDTLGNLYVSDTSNKRIIVF